MLASARCQLFFLREAGRVFERLGGGVELVAVLAVPFHAAFVALADGALGVFFERAGGRGLRLRGGTQGVSSASASYGPGGGNPSGNGTDGYYAGVYGNPQIIPLIGGSGGSGGSGWSGGGGGGSILVAAPSLITVTGTIRANGGSGQGFASGGGSGGAIRLISDQILGNGTVQAVAVGQGRIRVEANQLAGTMNFTPSTIAVPPPANAIIWPADTAPTVKVLSVDSIASPSDPSAPLISTSDIAIQKNGAVQVLLETRNFPTSGIVQFKYNQKYGSSSGWITASFVGGGFSIATWSSSVTFTGGFTTLQARATVP